MSRTRRSWLELGGKAQLVPKELEVYAGPKPPPDTRSRWRPRAIGRAADEAGLDRFHLLGFSGGGAASLVFTARHPERVISLALTEPAWIGNSGQTPEEQEYWDLARAMMDLPDAEFMGAFANAEMAPGVDPPPRPPGEPPPWMRLRPAGLHAMMRAFMASDFDISELEAFGGPVYFATGDLSSPRYAAIERRLSTVFELFAPEVYEGTSHMDPPHLARAARYAEALEAMWAVAPTG